MMKRRPLLTQCNPGLGNQREACPLSRVSRLAVRRSPQQSTAVVCFVSTGFHYLPVAHTQTALTARAVACQGGISRVFPHFFTVFFSNKEKKLYFNR